MDISCDLSGVTAEQRDHHRAVSAALMERRRDTTREGDTFTVTFEQDVPLTLIAEFVEFERRCCAFLDFDICGRDGRVCLELGGPAGAVAVIEELFPLVRA